MRWLDVRPDIGPDCWDIILSFKADIEAAELLKRTTHKLNLQYTYCIRHSGITMKCRCLKSIKFRVIQHEGTSGIVTLFYVKRHQSIRRLSHIYNVHPYTQFPYSVYDL